MGLDRKAVEKMLGRSLDAPAKPKTPVPKSKYRSKSEAAYALQLEARKRAGEIEDWRYEEVKFRVGLGENKTSWYTPDFMVIVHSEGVYGEDSYYEVEFHEVKGKHRHRPRGIAVFNAARDRYDWFKWVLVEV